MNPYNFKWIVKIPPGFIASGIHRYRTKKQAQEFLDHWLRLPESKQLTYAQIPHVEKDPKA